MSNALQKFRDELKAAIQKDPKNFFDHPDHNWKDYPGKLKGGSPYRESKTGTSFWVDLDKLYWEDPGMVNELGNYPHGDAIDYLQYLEDKDFQRASKDQFFYYVNKAAEKAGINPPEKTFKSEQDREIAYLLKRRSDAIRLTTELCTQYLLIADNEYTKAALEYLEGRKVTRDIIEEFGIGLFNQEHVFLNLIGSGFSPEEIKTFELFYNTNGISQFHNYLTVPWLDTSGYHVNIYFRYPHPDPKTLNKDRMLSLPNTEHPKYGVVYHNKSNLLGLYQALQSKQKDLTVIEGVFDWVLAKSLGDDSVVSPVGLILSNGQIESLVRHKKEINSITLVYDVDANKAGENASITQSKKLLREGFKTFIGKLPSDKDPADFLKEHSIEEWKQVVAEAPNAYKVLANTLVKNTTPGSLSDKAIATLETKAIGVLGFLESVPYDQRNVADLDTFWEVLAQYGLKRQEVPFKEPKKVEETQTKLAPEVIIKVREILEGEGDAPTKNLKLEQLRASTNYNAYGFSALVKSIKASLETKEDTKVDLLNKIALESIDLDVSNILPKTLAIAFKDAANDLNVSPINLLQFFLPAVASLIGSNSHAIVEPDSSFKVDPVLYAILVDYSGSGKSRTQDLITEYFFELQLEEERKAKEQREHHEELVRRWKMYSREEQKDLLGTLEDPYADDNKPRSRRKYLLQTAQMESVIKRLSEQPTEAGCLWIYDEFSGFLKGLDAYKSGGKGNARETFLTLYGNKPLTVELKNELDAHVVEKPNLSLIGCIVPDKARQIFSDPSDSDGFLARFLVAFPQRDVTDESFKWKRRQLNTNLKELLKGVYDGATTMNLGECRLSSKAIAIWEKFYYQTQKLHHENKEVDKSLSALSARLPAHTLKLALLLHHIHIICGEYKASDVIPDAVLAKAILLASYYVSQHRKLQNYGQAEEDSSKASNLHKIHSYAKNKGSVTYKEINSSSIGRSIRKDGGSVSKADIEAMFQYLANEGLGEFDGKYYRAHKNSDLKDLELKPEDLPEIAGIQKLAQPIQGVELSFDTTIEEEKGSEDVSEESPKEDEKPLDKGDLVTYDNEHYQIVKLNGTVAKLVGIVDQSVIKEVEVSNLQKFAYL